MRAWIRVPVDESCGSCRAGIPAGSIALEIRPGTAKLLRCGFCAQAMFGEPAPSTVAEDESLAPQPSLFTPAGAADQGFVRVGRAGRSTAVRGIVARATRDYRSRQSGGD